ncbi:unnamed protein product [Albugo candida]|uniref:Secreted protein n=1 Tax=Albugo candida TaxID=65357 RepID=A0A024GI42_9STRA|nr:unnamed protein product [Albugo candida]|eukprot:CCI46381.1 unnamed protein product [Albugo candida]
MNHIAAQCLVIIAFIMINSSRQHPGNNNEDTSDKKTLRQEINDLLVKFELLIADKKRASIVAYSHRVLIQLLLLSFIQHIERNYVLLWTTGRGSA